MSQKRVTSKKLMQKRVGYHDTMESASATQLAAIQAILASNPVTSESPPRVGTLCECDPLMKLYDPLLKSANDPLLNLATLF